MSNQDNIYKKKGCPKSIPNRKYMTLLKGKRRKGKQHLPSLSIRPIKIFLLKVKGFHLYKSLYKIIKYKQKNFSTTHYQKLVCYFPYKGYVNDCLSNKQKKERFH